MSFFADPKFEVIHGDAYITGVDDQIQSLVSHLTTAPYWLFEHIAAFQLCASSHTHPDLVLCLNPQEEQLQYRRLRNGRKALTRSELALIRKELDDQCRAIKELKIACVQSDSPSELLAHLIHVLWPTDLLSRRVTSLVLKVASRCNLNCSYCYMYHAHDTDWAAMASTMSPKTAEQVGVRIGEYLCETEQASMSVILHGGEPLLLGESRLQGIISSIRLGATKYADRIQFGMQTNGTLLNERVLALLDINQVSLGISLDGGTPAANSNRTFFDNQEAFSSIIQGLKAAQGYEWKKSGFTGTLAVIDASAAGDRVYEELRSLGLTRFDFLLPDINWDSPRAASLAAFLRDAFDAWLSDESPRHVRIFSTIVGHLFGRYDGVESFGPRPYEVMGVNTEGGFELHDVLRAAHPEAWKTSNTVFDSTLMAALRSPEVLNSWKNRYAFSERCLECRYLFACGGGYLPHRYSTSSGFLNPSVHCHDLFDFFAYAEKRISDLLLDASLNANCDAGVRRGGLQVLHSDRR